MASLINTHPFIARDIVEIAVDGMSNSVTELLDVRLIRLRDGRPDRANPEWSFTESPQHSG